MKTQSLSLILLLFAISCSNTSVPELKFGGLKGDVISCKEFKYEAEEKFGEIVPDELEDVIIYEFDKDGHQIKFGVYDGDGDLIHKYEDTYEKGVLVSRIFGYRDERTESRVIERKKNYVKWCYKIGTIDEYTTEVFYRKNSFCEIQDNGEKIVDLVFDKKGRPIDQIWYYSHGKILNRSLYEYNEKGLLVKTIQYSDFDEEGDVLTYQYTEFDKKGNWITSHVYVNGDLTWITKREITYR